MGRTGSDLVESSLVGFKNGLARHWRRRPFVCVLTESALGVEQNDLSAQVCAHTPLANEAIRLDHFPVHALFCLQRTVRAHLLTACQAYELLSLS